MSDLPVTQLLAQIRVQIESVVSYAESPLINQLETGFRHTPLTVRETEQRYSESCRFAAQDAAEALRLLGELEQKLAELEAENAWRPVEEARKDGTVVDVWVGGEFPGRLTNVSWREPTDSEWWVHGGDTIDAPDATWHDSFGPLGKDGQPTHFRPLPSPPKGPDA